MSGKVFGEWILVDIVEEPDEKTTKSGIVIPNYDKVKEGVSKTKECVVKQIGPDAFPDVDKLSDIPFKVGDHLLIYYQAGLISEEGHFIKKENVYMVLDKE